jgi:hypothetical protein
VVVRFEGRGTHFPALFSTQNRHGSHDRRSQGPLQIVHRLGVVDGNRERVIRDENPTGELDGTDGLSFVAKGAWNVFLSLSRSASPPL